MEFIIYRKFNIYYIFPLGFFLGHRFLNIDYMFHVSLMILPCCYKIIRSVKYFWNNLNVLSFVQ
jgi:hypothetical protein